MKYGMLVLAALSGILLSGCEELDDDPEKYQGTEGLPVLPLDDVAEILSEIPIGEEQVREVYDAVTSSSWNGYDEEYMMTDLFREPGTGVGDDRIGAEALAARRRAMGKASPYAGAAGGYGTPLRELIEEHLHSRQSLSGKALTKADGTVLTAEEYLAALESSDIQIYWPYSEDWDGTGYPVITFDPDDGGSTNVGYELSVDGDGNRTVREVIVDEEMAASRPVWVVNRNDDSGYTSLEMLRMQEPEWGEGGGEIIIGPRNGRQAAMFSGVTGGNEDGRLKTLLLKDFTMLRNYDSWFAGASEFFVKIGSVENFTAGTEAEMLVYDPTVTDFMIVVKRKYVGQARPFNAVLVSEWSEQLTHCALMISEDDGGTRTSWKCSAIVKVNSKSYGFDINLPVNTRDDIVWRGQLSRKYILSNDGVQGHFGDVDLTFELLEY